MKIDVEGMELEVISGFGETIERDPPRVFLIEIHPSSFFSGERGLSEDEQSQLKHTLEMQGYSLEYVTESVLGKRGEQQEFIFAVIE